MWPQHLLHELQSRRFIAFSKKPYAAKSFGLFVARRHQLLTLAVALTLEDQLHQARGRLYLRELPGMNFLGKNAPERVIREALKHESCSGF